MKQIFSILATILGIFFFGYRKGKQEEKNNNIIKENENIKENININQKVSNMSFDDKFDFLLSKQTNNKE